MNNMTHNNMTHNNMTHKTIFILVLFFPLFLQAKALELNEVLSSAVKHYPAVLEAIQNTETAKQKVVQARGQFDAYMLIEGDKRLEGYYDGRYADFKVVKPLRFWNSKVYAGHRVSGGNYPSYEGKLDTLDGGENRLGVIFSLWRDRAVDPKRLKLKNQKLSVKEKKFLENQKRLEAQRQAYIAYWEWVQKGKIYQIKKGLYDLAGKRAGAIQKKVASGALARIYAVENRQYLTQRKTDVIQSKQALEQAALKLGLFYRDNEGNPNPPKPQRLPAKFSASETISSKELAKDLKRALRNSPILEVYGPKIKAQSNIEEVGRNRLDPRFDVKFEVNKDRGEGAESLRGEEQRLMLNLEIPLERNLGKAIVAKAKSRRLALEYRRKLAKEKLEAAVKGLALQVNALAESEENLELEIRLAQKMERAETHKFQSGGSDFFLVNIREQKTAGAREKLVKTKFLKKMALGAYKEATLNFNLAL